ncbi:CatB-related O-acetyltransferase [Variovorax sp. H27-G14]|uniref:CatB-related O-acetyltransferase n=1 Tax=Variovorax sp. H27-G14 TaxID=3111914 RepID=UPI0038FCE827
MSIDSENYFVRRLAARKIGEQETKTASAPVALTVGRFTYGAENLILRQWGEAATLTIGSFCSLASEITVFLGGNHRTDWITTFPFGHIFTAEFDGLGIPGHPATRGNVSIGHDVWIGHGCTIMSGVIIGDGAVVAANSHVVKNVASYEIVGGNPARHIQFRFDPNVRDILSKLRWWDWSAETIKSRTWQLCEVPDLDRLSCWLEEQQMSSNDAPQ